MRSRRPSPEHEQAVARRLAALAAEWDTAKAVVSGEGNVRGIGMEPAADVDAGGGVVAPGGEWPWNPPTRVTGVASPASSASLGFEVVPALAPPTPLPPDPADDLPPLVRAPGRHVARRGSGRGLTEWMPTLAGRFVPPTAGARARLSSAHLTWVAVLVALAFGGTCWWLVAAKESTVLTPISASFSGGETTVPAQSPEQPGAATVPEPDQPAPSTSVGVGADGGGPEAVGEVVVDVAGKVRRPGIVVLPVGSRVADALEAAGGAKRGVDLSSLNLARKLLDGEQILVGRSVAPGVGTAPAPGAPSAPAGALVNLNSAGPAELETLPGVGPVTAAAIIEWRGRHGGFTAVEDLLEVDGIGEVTLKRLAPLVSV